MPANDPTKKRVLTEEQLANLAKAREKALEVRRAKAAIRKEEAGKAEQEATEATASEPEPPTEEPEPEPVPEPEPQESKEPPKQSFKFTDEHNQFIQAEVERQLQKMRPLPPKDDPPAPLPAPKEPKVIQRNKKKVRYVVEDSDSDSDEGEIILVKKAKTVKRAVHRQNRMATHLSKLPDTVTNPFHFNQPHQQF